MSICWEKEKFLLVKLPEILRRDLGIYIVTYACICGFGYAVAVTNAFMHNHYTCFSSCNKYSLTHNLAYVKSTALYFMCVS